MKIRLRDAVRLWLVIFAAPLVMGVLSEELVKVYSGETEAVDAALPFFVASMSASLVLGALAARIGEPTWGVAILQGIVLSFAQFVAAVVTARGDHSLWMVGLVLAIGSGVWYGVVVKLFAVGLVRLLRRETSAD